MNKYQKKNQDNKIKFLNSLPLGLVRAFNDSIFKDGVSQDKLLYIGVVSIFKPYYYLINTLLFFIAVYLNGFLMRTVGTWLGPAVFIITILFIIRGYSPKSYLLVMADELIFIPKDNEINYFRLMPDDVEVIYKTSLFGALKIYPTVDAFKKLNDSNKKAMVLSQYKVCGSFSTKTSSGNVNNVLYAILHSQFSEKVVGRDRLVRKFRIFNK